VAVIAPRTPYDNGVRYPGTEAAAAFQDAFAAAAPSPAATATAPAGARR